MARQRSIVELSFGEDNDEMCLGAVSGILVILTFGQPDHMGLRTRSVILVSFAVGL